MDFRAGKFADLQWTEQVRRKDLRTFRYIMIFLAVTTVLAGAALLPLHDLASLTEDQARRVGSAFLAAGIADSLILYFWDSIFGKA